MLTSFYPFGAISRVDQLTGMGTQKNVHPPKKKKLLGLTCLFLKMKFNETQKDFSINYP